VRRGSSTDPSKPALIEEIAQMRVGTTQPAAELLVEFSHLDRDDALGTKISWEAEYCEMPAKEMIPDLSPPRQLDPFGIDLSAIDPMNRLNVNFFREMADFEFARRLFRPVRLVVRNIGQVAANNVRAEITVPIDIGVVVIDFSDFPERPKQRADIFSNSALKGIKPAFRRDPGEVDIVKNSERFRIEINCGDLQPGRRVWSDVFYIGKESSGQLSLSGSIFADNLPQPKDFELTVSVTATKTAMSVYELCSRAEQAVHDE